MAKYFIIVAGAFLSVATFIHRAVNTMRGRVTRKAYNDAKWGLGFLISGLIAFSVLVFFAGTGSVIVLSGKQYMLLVLFSGVWMLIGLIRIVGYYVRILQSNNKKGERKHG